MVCRTFCIRKANRQSIVQSWAWRVWRVRSALLCMECCEVGARSWCSCASMWAFSWHSQQLAHCLWVYFFKTYWPIQQTKLNPFASGFVGRKPGLHIAWPLSATYVCIYNSRLQLECWNVECWFARRSWLNGCLCQMERRRGLKDVGPRTFQQKLHRTHRHIENHHSSYAFHVRTERTPTSDLNCAVERGSILAILVDLAVMGICMVQTQKNWIFSMVSRLCLWDDVATYISVFLSVTDNWWNCTPQWTSANQLGLQS